MKDVMVDGLSFNVEAVKGMKRSEFVATHFQLGVKHLKLEEGKARQWAGETYDALTGRATRQEQAEGKE